MYTFDVYLEKRLTEIDVTITQLLQREILTFDSWFCLYSSFDKLIEKVWVNGNLQMLFNATISDIAEKLFEQVDFKLVLSANADLVRKYSANGNEVKMELFADEINALREILIDSNSALEIFTKPLEDVLLYLYLGEYDVSAFLDCDITSLEQAKTIEFAECKISLRMQRYRLLEEIDDFEVGELDDKTLEELYWAAIVTTYRLITESQDSSKISVLSEASIETGRYRLLSEIDHLTLDELDSMSLHEIDFVKNA